MQSVHETITVIGEATGPADLSLNSNGQAELVFGDSFSAYITKIDDTNLELSFRLSDLDFADPGMMRAMLDANLLGKGTGNGRLAVDAVNGDVVYCERWSVEDMSVERAKARILSFGEYGAFWLTEGTDLILEASKPAEIKADMDYSEEAMIIRS